MPKSPSHAPTSPPPLEPIALDQLDRVSGGAGMGDMFGSLLNNAGPILQGITGLLGMFKGNGQQQQQAAAAPAAAAGPDPAAAAQAPAGGQAPMGAGGANPLVSVSVSMNGQQIASA